MSRPAKIATGLLVFAVLVLTALAIVEPLLYRWSFGEVPPANALDVGALFGALIGLLSVGVAAFGFFVWRILAHQVQREAEAVSRQSAAMSSAMALDLIGYRAWQEYWQGTRGSGLSPEEEGLEHSKDPKGFPEIESAGQLNDAEMHRARLHLETAVKLSEVAAGLRKDFGTSRDEEEWSLTIANSFAYYLAERGDPADRARALALVEEIEGGVSKFPDAAAICEDTIRHVRNRYDRLRGEKDTFPEHT